MEVAVAEASLIRLRRVNADMIYSFTVPAYSAVDCHSIVPPTELSCPQRNTFEAGLTLANDQELISRRIRKFLRSPIRPNLGAPIGALGYIGQLSDKWNPRRFTPGCRLHTADTIPCWEFPETAKQKQSTANH